MRERWMALELGQRRLAAGLVAGILAIGLVTAGVALLSGGGSGGDQQLKTASGPSTSSTTATTADAAGATSSTTTAVTGGSSSTTSSSSSTSTTAKGKSKGGIASSPTTTKAKGAGGGGSGPTTTVAAATTTIAPAGPCSTGGSSQADQIATLYCSYRRSNGEAAMSRNSALDGVAQQWAQKLAADADAAVAAGQQPGLDPQKSHNTSDNPTATYPGGYEAAVRADCSRCTRWAENVAFDTSASGAWQRWLGSSTHLQNIQDGPHGGEFGVGAAQGGGYWWYVQDFGFYP